MSSEIPNTADPDKIDPASAVGFTSAPFEFDYTFKVTIVFSTCSRIAGTGLGISSLSSYFVQYTLYYLSTFLVNALVIGTDIVCS